MIFDTLFSGARISSSGLAGERMRMEVVANNIANANSTRSPSGGPFRRQDVVFSSILDQRLSGSQGRGGAVGGLGSRGRVGGAQGGVQVVDIVDDPSPFHQVNIPGHPDADANGNVSMPNINLPTEMINLVTASRAYEANLRALQSYRQMAEQSLTLLHPQS